MGGERLAELEDFNFVSQTPKLDTSMASNDLEDMNFSADPKTNKRYDLSASKTTWQDDIKAETKQYVDYYSAQSRTGVRGLVQAWGGLQALTGVISDADLKNNYGSSQLEAEDQELIDTFEKKVGNANFLTWAGPAIQALPQMGVSAAGGLYGSVVVPGIAGVVTGGRSAPATPVLRELGSKIGMFTVSAGLMAGQAYNEYLKDPNVDPVVAKRTALAVGAAQALVETLQLRQLGGLARKGVIKAVKTESGAATMEALHKDFMKTMLVQAGEEVLQDVNIAEIGNYIVSKFGNADTLVPTLDKVLQKTNGTLTNALKAGAVMGGVSTAFRKRSHLTTSEYKKLIDTMFDDNEINESLDEDMTPEEKAQTEYSKLFDTDAEVLDRRVSTLNAAIKDTAREVSNLERKVNKAQDAVNKARAAHTENFSSATKQDLASKVKDLEDLQTQYEDSVKRAESLDKQLQSTKREQALQNAERKQIKHEKMEDVRSFVDKVYKAINAKRSVDEAVTKPGAVEPTPMQQKMRALGHSMFSWEGKMRILFQDLKDSKEMVAAFDAFKSAQAEITGRRKALNKMRKLIMAETGLTEDQVVKLMVKGAQDTVSFTDINGTKIELTANEAAKFEMQMRDPSLRSGLVNGNKFTLKGEVAEGQSTQEKIQDSLDLLDVNYRMAAKGVQKFYKSQYDSLAKAYKEETGEDLENNPFYSGFAQRRGYALDNMQDAFTATLTKNIYDGPKNTGKPGTVISRVNSDLALEKSDIYLDAIRQTTVTEHWKVWRNRKELAAVFSDPKVRKAIELKYGSAFMDGIDAHLGDMMNTNHKAKGEWDDFVQHIMRNAGTAFLGLKPLQFFKQMTGYLNLGIHISDASLVFGVGSWAANPIENTKRIMSSNWYKNRYSNFDSTISGTINQADIQQLEKYKLKDFLLFALKAGDKGVAIIGGHAAYEHYRKQGMSEKDAMLAAGKAIETTQSSGMVSELSNLARDPGWKKVVSIFLQAPTRLAEFRLQALREAWNHGGKAWHTWARTEAYTHLAQSAFAAVGLAAVMMSPKSDDEEKKTAIWNWAMETLNGPSFPVMGDLLKNTEAFANFAQNQLGEATEFGNQRIFDFKAIPLEAINNSIRLAIDSVKAGVEYKEEGSIKPSTAIKLTLEYARSLNLLKGGYPIEPPIKEIKSQLKENE